MASGDFTRINSNIAAMNSLNSLRNINTKLGVHQMRLATGKRINEAAEDPAGLTIATKFSYRSSGLGVALDNIGDAKNLLAVAEGGLAKINDILIQMRDKALQAASDALGSAERDAIKAQLESFNAQINNIVAETKWNNNALLDGTVNMTFQTGADASEETGFALAQNHNSTVDGLNTEVAVTNSVGGVDRGVSGSVTGLTIGVVDTNQDVTNELASGTYKIAYTSATKQLTISDSNDVVLNTYTDSGEGVVADGTITYNGLTITFGASLPSSDITATPITYTAKVAAQEAGHDVSSHTNVTAYIQRLDGAIANVSKSLSDIGALSARLTFKEETLSVARVNTEAAFNRIMNADMASEQLEATKLQILQQTATAMLAQANMAPQSVLSLFR